MAFPKTPQLTLGAGDQVGIITLWTKKEHVLRRVPGELYAAASQLFSRDEGISELVRSLLANKNIRDIIVTGTDLNHCAKTLFALWNNGVRDGQVIGANGYIDADIPLEAIERMRRNVSLHDMRGEKDYARLADYIRSLPRKESWESAEEYPRTRISPPPIFPDVQQQTMRHDSINDAAVELAHLCTRFGTLANVQIHLTSPGKLPSILADQETEYTNNLLGESRGTYGEHLHKKGRLDKLVSTLTSNDEAVISFCEDEIQPLLELVEVFRKDILHLCCHLSKTSIGELPLLASGMFHLLDLVAGELDEPAGTVTINAAIVTPTPTRIREALSAEANVLRSKGDPRSNILIRLEHGKINITQLSPDGKRLDEISAATAGEAYKRLVVEHRIKDLSHAAYLGYELAKAEQALKTGDSYEQDRDVQ